MSNQRHRIQNGRRWVVKIGSAILTNDGKRLDHRAIEQWIAQIAQLVCQGYEVIIVSSGAVIAGMTTLHLDTRPRTIHQLQAMAAVGQMQLMQVYAQQGALHQLSMAQMLLTAYDFNDREHYLNARTTLQTLLTLNVVPVINENDSIAVQEICFGDNDTLAGLVANLIQADVLLILTDQQGFYNADPRSHKEATLIERADVHNTELDDMAGIGGVLGRGGMQTKLSAARIAARSGTQTLLASGLEPDILLELARGRPLGTWLYNDDEYIDSRKCWLGAQSNSKGKVVVDDGAYRNLMEGRKSLLPIGVQSVQGHFNRGDLISCIDNKGVEFARGLSNYDHRDCRQIIGMRSHEIINILGYCHADELIHYDNLLLV